MWWFVNDTPELVSYINNEFYEPVAALTFVFVFLCLSVAEQTITCNECMSYNS